MKFKLIFIFAMLLMIPMVSALEFDNLRTYDNETRTITIKNSILRIIPTTTIVEIQLTSELNKFVDSGDSVLVAEL